MTNENNIAQLVRLNNRKIGSVEEINLYKDYRMNEPLRSFAIKCVSHYATYDKADGFFSLDIYDLPDFVRHEFAAHIMSDNDSWAAEATGPDNPHWESKMLPALTRYLKNSTCADEAIEFQNTWRDCVADYMTNHMQYLLNDLIPEVFN